MFIGITDEIAILVMLDSKGKVLLSQKLSEGTKDATPITPRKVAEIALRNGAQKVILAHNHPGGIAIPSQEDFTATAEVVKVLSLFGIRLLDHIVVADGDYVSFRQSGFLND
jgi:DNA repair protein RadC